MARPVVHFEIIGKNPEKLRNYFGELFIGSVTLSRSATDCTAGLR